MLDNPAQFKRDAIEGLDNWRMVSREVHAVRAASCFGSNYECYKTPVLSYNGLWSGDYLFVVYQPWQAVHIVSPGAYIEYDTFIKHWGDENRKQRVIYVENDEGVLEEKWLPDNHHGGDVYSLMKCMATILGVKYREPEDVVFS